MSLNRLIIAIDTKVITTDLCTMNDFTSRQVGNLISLPLVYYNHELNSYLPGAANGYHIAPECNQITFTIRPDLCWSDGKPVLPKDYYDSIVRYIDQSPGALCLRHLKNFFEYKAGKVDVSKLGVIYDDSSICFTCEKLDYKLINKLARINISPQKDQSSGGSSFATAGPYIIESFSPTEVLLSPNEFAPAEMKDQVPVSLKYYSKPADAAKAFLNHTIDSTCKAGYDANTLETYQLQPTYQCSLSQLYHLIFFTGEIFYDQEKRKQLRDNVLSNFNYNNYHLLIAEEHGFSGSFGTKRPKAKAYDTQNLSISLAYDNYYPNDIFCHRVKEIIDSNGGALRLIKTDFHNPDQESADLKYMVVDNLYPNSLKLYYDIGQSTASLMTVETRTTYWYYLRLLETSDSPELDGIIINFLDTIIWDNALVINFGVFIYNYLANNYYIKHTSQSFFN